MLDRADQIWYNKRGDIFFFFFVKYFTNFFAAAAKNT